MKLDKQLPIREALAALLKVLGNGLPIGFGLTAKAPTGGLLADISRDGERVRIRFAEGGRAIIKFDGELTDIVVDQHSAKFIITGTPGIDVECEVV